MNKVLPWIDERNRNKLIDALQAAQFPVSAGVSETGMIGQRFTVPSHSDPRNEYVVEHIYHWDGKQETRCSCPWGEAKGPFWTDGQSLPCRHALIVRFWLLPTELRDWLLDNDYGIGNAYSYGLDDWPSHGHIDRIDDVLD